MQPRYIGTVIGRYTSQTGRNSAAYKCKTQDIFDGLSSGDA
jgi:hypothetical protein